MADHTLSKQEYLTKLPATVPTGLVLVHNSVRPAKRLGTRGFRARLDSPAALCHLCLRLGAGTRHALSCRSLHTELFTGSTRRSRHSLAPAVAAIARSVCATASAPMKNPRVARP